MATPISDTALTISEGRTDRAILGIVLSNVFAIVVVLVTQSGLLTLLWPYWLQSLVIGYYARRRILARGTSDARRLANFFAVHYGGFHLGYFAFLWTFTSMAAGTGIVPVTVNGVPREVEVGMVGLADAISIVAIGIGFVLSHRASHREHLEADLRNEPAPKKLMGIPYARIVPMHMTIILGLMAGHGLGIPLFGVLKTIADVGMHKLEHRSLQRS